MPSGPSWRGADEPCTGVQGAPSDCFLLTALSGAVWWKHALPQNVPAERWTAVEMTQGSLSGEENQARERGEGRWRPEGRENAWLTLACRVNRKFTLHTVSVGEIWGADMQKYKVHTSRSLVHYRVWNVLCRANACRTNGHSVQCLHPLRSSAFPGDICSFDPDSEYNPRNQVMDGSVPRLWSLVLRSQGSHSGGQLG